jgi:hypothetical protein
MDGSKLMNRLRADNKFPYADPEGTDDEQENDQHAEGERHDVVDVVGAGRDVEKEDEMNSHLRDRQNGQRDGNARTLDKCGARDKERHDCEQRREASVDHKRIGITYTVDFAVTQLVVVYPPLTPSNRAGDAIG